MRDALALRLASVTLALKMISMVVELSFYIWGDDKHVRQRARLTLFLHGLMSIFAVLFGFLITTRTQYSSSLSDNPLTTADADIAGDGVRTATWIQVLVLAFMALAGCFFTGYLAVQELGAGLLVSHLALAIALLAPVASREISPVNLILGTMILDAQNSGLSIQLVTKQTLASRWQTFTVLLGQIAGLITIGILINKFTADEIAGEEHQCLPVAWWGWVSECADGQANDHKPIWIYYSLRVLSTVHCGIYASCNVCSMDEAKRQEVIIPCAKCETCQDEGRFERMRVHPSCECELCPGCDSCIRCKAPQCGVESCKLEQACNSCKPWRKFLECKKCPGMLPLKEGRGLVRGRKYSQIGMTTCLLWVESFVYSFITLLAAESFMFANGIQPSSPLKSFGQVMAIVVAVATGIRAMWVFLSLFWKEDAWNYVLSKE